MKPLDKKFIEIKAKAEKQLSLSATLASEVANDIIKEFEYIHFYGMTQKDAEFVDKIRQKYRLTPLRRPMLLIPVSSEKFRLLSSTSIVDLKLGKPITLPVSVSSDTYVLFYLTNSKVPLEGQDMNKITHKVMALARIDQSALSNQFIEWVSQFSLPEQEELSHLLLNPLLPVVTDLLPLRDLHYLAVPRELDEYETPTHKRLAKLINPQFVIRK